MSVSDSTEKKQFTVTENSAQSTPIFSPQDEKHLASPSESIYLEIQAPRPARYHVFTRTRKLEMVWIVSAAAIFSPLSSNIYFPALGMISRVSQHALTSYIYLTVHF